MKRKVSLNFVSSSQDTQPGGSDSNVVAKKKTALELLGKIEQDFALLRDK